MSHRRLLGSMSPLDRFSAIPYVLSPFTGNGDWRQEHQQAHSDFVGILPGWYGTTIIGVVISIDLTNGGSDYTAVPTVTITGGSGTGATAVATIAGGVVTRIDMTSQGVGYLPSDTLTITITPAPGDTTGTGAAATAVITPITAPFTSQAGTAQFLSPGYNIQDVNLNDPQELEFWVFQNHLAHLDAEFVQNPDLWVWPFW
jgi:hypothetical protein